jgi:UDP-N-acetylglucosamine acyltransferase
MAIKRAYKSLYKSGLSFDDAKVEISAQVSEYAELQILSEFLSNSTRGIVR